MKVCIIKYDLQGLMMRVRGGPPQPEEDGPIEEQLPPPPPNSSDSGGSNETLYSLYKIAPSSIPKSSGKIDAEVQWGQEEEE